MSKYIIRIESVEHDDGFEETYGKGIECDGFCIIGDTDKGTHVALHGVNIEGLSAAIMRSDTLMSAGILAKARKEIIDMSRNKLDDALSKLRDAFCK